MATHNPAVLQVHRMNGDIYYIHADGAIERGDQPGRVYSGAWHLRGLVRTGPGWAFGTGLIPFPELWRRLQDGQTLEWLYKNGAPRYTGADLDHGSARVWGNVKYGGVRAVYLTAAGRATRAAAPAGTVRTAGTAVQGGRS